MPACANATSRGGVPTGDFGNIDNLERLYETGVPPRRCPKASFASVTQLLTRAYAVRLEIKYEQTRRDTVKPANHEEGRLGRVSPNPGLCVVQRRHAPGRAEDQPRDLPPVCNPLVRQVPADARTLRSAVATAPECFRAQRQRRRALAGLGQPAHVSLSRCTTADIGRKRLPGASRREAATASRRNDQFSLLKW